ncbi:MAG: DUF952 domain-containing protein [Rhizomicrobium sp.]|jgi:uncharacterized protein (DUF952 family)
MLIFKIVHAREWAEADGEFRGSAKDRADGFLHFSTAGQLPGTLARYYANGNDLLLVAVKSEALGEALKFEPSTGGELYPHLSGPLPTSTVTWVRELQRDHAGNFILPLQP